MPPLNTVLYAYFKNVSRREKKSSSRRKSYPQVLNKLSTAGFYRFQTREAGVVDKLCIT